MDDLGRLGEKELAIRVCVMEMTLQTVSSVSMWLRPQRSVSAVQRQRKGPRHAGLRWSQTLACIKRT
jgi:hypothetical protein